MDDLKKNIQLLLVENEDSGLLLEDNLKDSDLNTNIDVKLFNNENELLSYLKTDHYQENILKGASHSIIIFNLNPPLDYVINIIKIIKKDPELKIIPVFMVTSSIDTEEIANCYNCHVNCYLVKPNDLKGLLDIMESFKKLWLEEVKLP